MATSYISEVIQQAKLYIKAFAKWMGVTAGSWTDIPGNHMNIGKIFLERGEPQEALRRFKLAAWMRPKSPHPYALMVAAHAALGEVAEAQQAYKQAVKFGYKDVTTLQQIITAAKNPAPVKQAPAEPAAPPASASVSTTAPAPTNAPPATGSSAVDETA